jgi:hypothetical protein
MTRIEQAISAARGQMRHVGIDPATRMATDAEATLDDLARMGNPAGKWLQSANCSQVDKFRKEWEKWRLQIELTR